ncbi:MAG: hypothetical protein L6N96_01865 [Candidatus Methylarchaceae archaeon HK02M2]|nr:hypothetical protein [Candidatus Methylarchaceae archaeon HK02M2]
MASGVDRPEDSYKQRPKPKPPITLTHPLSKGSVVKKNDEKRLIDANKETELILEEASPILKKSPMEVFLKIFEKLKNSQLTKIPAYTEPPINDNSLFDHLKLTTAIATVIYLSSGYVGDLFMNYFCVLN